MDKELQQLLDEARANGASVEQLDDIYNRYVKKKEGPEPSGVSESPSLSAGENLINNVKNVWYQIEGIPPRFALSITSTVEKTLGQEAAEFVSDAIFSSNPVTSGLAAFENTKDLMQVEAMRTLKELESDMSPVNALTDSQSWNSVAKSASNIAGAVMQIVPTAVSGALVPGVGIYADMMGYGLYDYNSELAKRKGKTIEQLYQDEEDEFLIPATIGASAGYLERKGFKGATKTFSEAMSKSGTKRIAKAFLEGGIEEGFTEWFQSGMEEANRSIARGEEDFSKKQADFMFSKQGLENLLIGAISGGFLGGAGGALNRNSIVGDTENGEIKNKLRTEISELDDLAKDQTLDPEERQTYKDLRDEKVEQYKEAQQQETEFYNEFSDEDYNEVKNIDSEIVSVLNKIDSFKSEAGKEPLKAKAQELVEKKKQVEQKYRKDDSEKETGLPSPKQEQKAPVKAEPVAKPSEEKVAADRDVQEAQAEDLAAQKAQAIKAGLGPTVQNLRTAIQALEAQKAKVAEEGADVAEYDAQINQIQGMVDKIEQSAQPAVVEEPAPKMEKSEPKKESPKKSFTIESANIVTESSPDATKELVNKKFTQEFKKSLGNATSMTEFIGTYGQQGDRFTIDRATYVIQNVEEAGNKKRVNFSLVDSEGNRKRNYTATIENGKPVTIRNAKGLIDVFAKKKKATYDRFKKVADAKKVEVEVKKEKGKKEQRIFKPKTKKGVRYAMAKAFGLKDAQAEAATEIIYRGMKNLANRKGIEISDIMKGIRYVKGTERDAERLLRASKTTSMSSTSIHNDSMTLAQLNPIENKILEKHTKEGIDDPIVVEGINILNKITGKNVLRRPEGQTLDTAVTRALEMSRQDIYDMAASKMLSLEPSDIMQNRSLDALLRLDAAGILGIKTDFNSPLSEQISNEQVETAKGTSFENALRNTARDINIEQQATIGKWIDLLTTIRTSEAYWDGANWIPQEKINAQEKLRALVLFDKLLVSKYDLATDKDYKRNNKSTDQFPFLIERVAIDWIKSGKSDEHPLKSYTKMVGEAKKSVIEQANRVVYNKNGVKVYKFKGVDSDSNFGESSFNFNEEVEALTIMTQDTVFCTKTMASSQLRRGDFYLMLDENNKVVTAINLDNSTRTIVEIKGSSTNQERIAEFKNQEHDFIQNSGEINNGAKFVQRELLLAESEFSMPAEINSKDEADQTIKSFLQGGNPINGDDFIREFNEKGGWEMLGVTPEQVMLISPFEETYEHNDYLREIGNLNMKFDEETDATYYYPESDIKVIINLDTDGPEPYIVYRDGDVNIEKAYLRERERINIELPNTEVYDVNIGDVSEVINMEYIDEASDLSGTSEIFILPNGTQSDWDNLTSTTNIKVSGKVDGTLHVKTKNGIWNLEVLDGGYVNRTATTKSYGVETPASLYAMYGDIFESEKTDTGLSIGFFKPNQIDHRDLGPGSKIKFEDYWISGNEMDVLFQVSQVSKEIKEFKSKDKKEAEGKARELRKKYKLMNLKVYKYGGEYKIRAIRDAKTEAKKIKGAMVIEDSAFMIYALTSPDVSTPLHEFSHVYERYLTPEEIKIVEKWSGFKRGTVDFSEAFARGFERYLYDGKAPVPALQKIFDNLRKWLKNIYDSIRFKAISRELTPEVRDIFDNMILTPAEKAQMQKEVEDVAVKEAEQAKEVAEVKKPKEEPVKKPAPKKTTGDPLKLPGGRLDLDGGNYIEYKGLKDGKHMYSYFDEMFGAAAEVDEASARALMDMDSGPLYQAEEEDTRSARQIMDEIRNESEKQILLSEEGRKKQFIKRVKTEWSDRQGTIRKKLLQSGLNVAESLMTNRAGSKARGVNRFHKYEKSIYKDLTKPEEKLTEEILLAERIVQIEVNRRARRALASKQIEKINANKQALEDALNLNLSKEERAEIKSLIKKIDDKTKELKKRIEDNGVMKHPGGMTEQSAREFLENEAPKLSYYPKSKEAADKYFSAMNEQLKIAFEAGLIDEQTYERFKSDKYITRIFLDKIFNVDVDENGEMITTNYSGSDMYKETGLSVDQIKTLKSGSEGAVILDSRYILESVTVSISNRVAVNEMNTALAKSLANQTALPWYKPANYKLNKDGEIVTDKFGNAVINKPNLEFENVFYRVGGKLRAFQIQKDLADEWNDATRKISQDSLVKEGLKAAGGVSLLKAGATGYNPLFFISNVPMDIANVLFFTDIYDDNALLPVSFFKVSRNVTKLTKGLVQADANLKTKDAELASQLLDEYVENGGMMDFFYTYGQEGVKGLAKRLEEEGKLKIGSTTKKLLAKAGQGLQYTGEKTEIAMRLASYSQVKNKLTKERKAGKNEYTDDEIKAIAVAKARKTMDFNQGGTSAKELDRWVPYLNAAIQGFRISREYITKNPGKFMTKISQIGLAVSALVMYNLGSGDDEDDYDNIPDYIKDNYFVIMLPTKDEDGNPQYIRIRKTQSLVPFLTMFEMLGRSIYYSAKGEKDPQMNDEKINRVWDSIQDALPVSIGIKENLSKLPPTIVAAYKYYTNYDLFRRAMISPENEFGVVSPEMEGKYDDRIPLFYKAIAEHTGMSPRRMKSAVETITTSPSTNGLVAIAYSMGDFVTNMLYTPETGEKSIFNGNVLEVLSGIKKSALEKVVRSSYPGGKKEKQEKVKKIEMLEGDTRYRIKKVTDMMAREKDLDGMKEFLGTIEIKEDRKYAIERYNKIAKTDLSKIKDAYDILDVMYTRDPEAQAKVYIYYFGLPDLKTREGAKELSDQLAYMKKTLDFKPSKRFIAELKRQAEN